MDTTYGKMLDFHTTDKNLTNINVSIRSEYYHYIWIRDVIKDQLISPIFSKNSTADKNESGNYTTYIILDPHIRPISDVNGFINCSLSLFVDEGYKTTASDKFELYSNRDIQPIVEGPVPIDVSIVVSQYPEYPPGRGLS